LKNRGYTPQALLSFCYTLGISKQDTVIPKHNLEKTIRSALDVEVQRCFLVREPLRLTLRQPYAYMLTIPNHPKIPALGTRAVSFSSSLCIEKEDFVEHLGPGQKKITLQSYFKLIGVSGLFYCYAQENDEIFCDYMPDDTSRIAAQATVHWLDNKQHETLTIYDYEQLSPRKYYALGEPHLVQAPLYSRYQCYRFGYIYKCGPTSFTVITTLKPHA